MPKLVKELKRLLWRYEAGYCDEQALVRSVEAAVNGLDGRIMACRAETLGLTHHPSHLFVEYDEAIMRTVGTLGGTEYRDCIGAVLRAAAVAARVEKVAEASREFAAAKEAHRAVELAVDSEWLAGAMTMRVMSELLFAAEACLRRCESHQAAFIARLCAGKGRALLSPGAGGAAGAAARLGARISRLAEVAAAVERFEATPREALLVRNAMGSLARLVEGNHLTLAEQLVSDCESDFEVRRQFLKAYGWYLDRHGREGRSKLAIDDELQGAIARGSWAAAVEHLLRKSLDRLSAEMQVLQSEAAEVTRRVGAYEQTATA